MSSGACILTINGGSSSIKFAVYRMYGEQPRKGLRGKIDRIGLQGTHVTFDDPIQKQQGDRNIGELDHRLAADFLLDWLAEQIGFSSITAAGHRVVHGGAKYREPHRITQEVLWELRLVSAYAPEHLPSEINMIELVDERMPSLPQVACFDTGFHRDMPRVVKPLAIPWRVGAPVIWADQRRFIRADEDAIIAEAVFGMLVGAETGQHAHPEE